LEAVEELVRALLGFLSGKSVNMLQRESDVLQGGEVGEEVVGLEDDANFSPVGAEA
jgi:hypothetical protein